MKSVLEKPPWTRGEKWLLATPLLILLCAFCLTSGKEILRRKMGWPVVVIHADDDLQVMGFSPDGKYIAATGLKNNRDTFVWDAHTSALKHQFKGVLFRDKQGRLERGFPVGIAFSSNGSRVFVSKTGAPLEIYDVQSGILLSPQPKATSGGLSFSSDGRYLAVKHQILDAESLHIIRSFPLQEGVFQPLVFSPDNRLVASLEEIRYSKELRMLAGGKINLWEISSGKLKRTLPSRLAHAIKFSPDGKSIALIERIPVPLGNTTSGGRLRLFDTDKANELWSVTTKEDSWFDLAVSPDGKWIVCQEYGPEGELHFFDAKTGSLKFKLFYKGKAANSYSALPSLAFSRDGKTLASRTPNQICIWNMDEVNARFAPRT